MKPLFTVHAGEYLVGAHIEQTHPRWRVCAFWFLSLGGALMLLTYAIHREDPVFILGQSAGMFIYSRNLWFIYRGKPDPRP